MSTTAREGNKEQLDTNGARQMTDKIFDPDDSEASSIKPDDSEASSIKPANHNINQTRGIEIKSSLQPPWPFNRTVKGIMLHVLFQLLDSPARGPGEHAP